MDEVHQAIRSVGLSRRFVELESDYVGLVIAQEEDEFIVILGATRYSL